jgi:Sec-independent protein translocase protein TatA
MDILGIGPLEFVFILIIFLVIVGPRDMVQMGRTLGKFFRGVFKSETWRSVQQVTRELRSIPTRLVREAGLDELKEDMEVLSREQKEILQEVSEIRDSIPTNKELASDLSAWTQPVFNEPNSQTSERQTNDPPAESAADSSKDTSG